MCKAPPPPKRRVFFYVDGFNLYHRRLENEPSHKWLCLRALAEQMFPNDRVEKIKFFTAKVDPKAPNDAPTAKQRRQQIYWDAIKSRGVEVIEGILEPRPRTCKAAACGRGLTYETMSEKMSDVNLALHVYGDYIEHSPDIICVLSADLDVVPALWMVRSHSHKVRAEAKQRGVDRKGVMLVVYLPTQDDGLLYSRQPELRGIAITKRLSDVFVRNARLPETIELKPGAMLQCPDTWLPQKKVELPPEMYR